MALLLRSLILSFFALCTFIGPTDTLGNSSENVNFYGSDQVEGNNKLSHILAYLFLNDAFYTSFTSRFTGALKGKSLSSKVFLKMLIKYNYESYFTESIIADLARPFVTERNQTDKFTNERLLEEKLDWQIVPLESEASWENELVQKVDKQNTSVMERLGIRINSTDTPKSLSELTYRHLILWVGQYFECLSMKTKILGYGVGSCKDILPGGRFAYLMLANFVSKQMEIEKSNTENEETTDDQGTQIPKPDADPPVPTSKEEPAEPEEQEKPAEPAAPTAVDNSNVPQPIVPISIDPTVNTNDPLNGPAVVPVITNGAANDGAVNLPSVQKWNGLPASYKRIVYGLGFVIGTIFVTWAVSTFLPKSNSTKPWRPPRERPFRSEPENNLPNAPFLDTTTILGICGLLLLVSIIICFFYYRSIIMKSNEHKTKSKKSKKSVKNSENKSRKGSKVKTSQSLADDKNRTGKPSAIEKNQLKKQALTTVKGKRNKTAKPEPKPRAIVHPLSKSPKSGATTSATFSSTPNRCLPNVPSSIAHSAQLYSTLGEPNHASKGARISPALVKPTNKVSPSGMSTANQNGANQASSFVVATASSAAANTKIGSVQQQLISKEIPQSAAIASKAVSRTKTTSHQTSSIPFKTALSNHPTE